MQNYNLTLEDGENVELRSSGAFSPEPSGRWRIGEWVKTNRRLLFLQFGRVRFSTGLNSLIAYSPCEREYSFKKIYCLKITFNNGSDNKVFWFMTSDIILWDEMFAEYLEDIVTETDMSKMSQRLGHEGEKILWFLYRKQHATIAELADAIGAENHIDVLNIIRGDINPAAKELIGRPILIFKPEGFDQKGSKIAYSWWFACCQKAQSIPFSDVIDEGEFYRIIVESPPDAEDKLKDNHLYLKNRHGFAYSMVLPPNSSHTVHNRSYRNGVLELCIMKQT